jgi:hypothetical protein
MLLETQYFKLTEPRTWGIRNRPLQIKAKNV